MSDFEPPRLPPIAAEPVSVVLPAHNAEEVLPKVLRRWAGFLDGLKRDYEILVVDDGSSDRTAALADGQPHVRVLRHETRRGVGAALRTGLAEAKHPLVCYAPCDHQYRPADLQKMLERIDEVHMVAVCRAGPPIPAGLRWLGVCYRVLVRVLFGVPLEPLPTWRGGRHWLVHALFRVLFGLRLHDVTSAFRLFRRDALARLPIQSDGPFVHVELLAKANFLECFMDEAPVADARAKQSEALRPMLSDLRRVLSHPEFS
jgi:glycosyltransferase involved in cell wall biosynthesis